MEIVLWVVLVLTGAFIIQGLRKIPADPPHVAVVTIFGKRTSQVKREGWRFFPLYPFWYGAVLVDITQKNKDLAPQAVRTPELGEIEVAVSATWRPNPEPTPNTDPDGNSLIKYLNVGGQVGVENILTDIIEEKTREFAIHNVGSWEELLKVREDLVAIIAADIVGEGWDELSREEQARIVAGLREGNGILEVRGLGIMLIRLNVTGIKPLGGLARTAELEAKERQEQRAEILEMEHVKNMIGRLTVLGFSNEQALEIVQTERGKVTKNIKEIKMSVSRETRHMIEEIGDNILARVLRGRET